MRGQQITFIIMLFLFCACEFRWEDAAEADEPPQIYFLENNQQIWKDSLKIGLKSNLQRFNFQIGIRDNNPELIEIGSVYEALQGESVVINEVEGNTVGKNEKNYQVEFIPVKTGKNIEKKELTIYAKDHFGNRSNIYLELMVYENLKPIAILQFKKIGNIKPGHFEINALHSYDQDEKYGGKITEYIYEIDGKIIQTKKPVIEFIFQEPGNYELKLKVKDNDGAWSEELRSLVPINF